MAVTAVQAAMNLEEKKSVHPFFSKTPRNIPELNPLANETSAGDPHHEPDHELLETGAPKIGKKRGRKPGTAKNKDDTGKTQASMEGFARRPNPLPTTEITPVDAQEIITEPSPEEGLDQPRTKRRKTASPGPALNSDATIEQTQAAGTLNWQHQLQAETVEESAQDSRAAFGTVLYTTATDAIFSPPKIVTEGLERLMTPPNTTVTEPESNPVPETTNPAAEAPKATVKKVLKVNKNGKLLSPSSTKARTSAEPEDHTQKKRRRRNTSKAKPSPTVTIIKYGFDPASRQAIGEKIETVMNRMKVARRPATTKKAPLKAAGPSRATHPFFLGKTTSTKDDIAEGKPATNATLPSPRSQRKSAVTPGKLRAESRCHQSAAPKQAFGAVFGSSRAPKQVGLGEPPWPSKETAHVRNLDIGAMPYPPAIAQSVPLKSRKMKNAVQLIPEYENIMAKLAQQLTSSIQRRCQTPSSEFEPPRDVRLPTRLVTTGIKIQEEVRSQVRTTLPAARGQVSERSRAHPAVQSLFLDIEHTLTPFDLGKCESMSWNQKYAPTSASHILQPGKESLVLRDWLSSLTVLAVGGKQDDSKNTIETRKPPKKKRKKDIDNFIANSDEEDDEDMVALENGHAYEYGYIGSTSSTSIRRPRWTRNKNVVLISGPHGCGKSALVYAVAKELGFEVFEINSGTRRSGRDILDKVGDMSENHLVNHQRHETMSKKDEAQTDDTDGERHSTALQNDLESGRQGTMTSFFKSSGTVKPKPKPVTQDVGKSAPTSAQMCLPSAQSQRKSQKQSLILFEEADILFEEDQQFWAQVTKLASQSKRPIVLTCNNETLLPIYDLPLAAILRLTPPPVDLATDYMLVLAGREGHILERNAVSSLYRSKRCDLRASITELNLWCQMSVGDKKGGLEWIYQRWPPGNDVDENGQPIRVASKGTFQPGMGYVSHNMFKSASNIAFDKKQELLKETWASWGINPSEWNYDEDITGHGLTSTKISTLAVLERLDALSDSISAADIYCRVDMPSYEHYNKQPTDPSLPPLPGKERVNYTISAPVIKIDHMTDFSQFDTEMFVQSHLSIHRTHHSLQTMYIKDRGTIPTTEEGFTQAILDHQQNAQYKHSLARPDFSEAFDLLAFSPDTFPAMNTSYNLIASSFDRTFRIVVEDIAPYVRSIVSHELVLETQRIRLGSLLSEGGGMAKRQRTTRAARVALEGGMRETKRRERWFDCDLNRTLVMATAGKSWTGMGSGAEDVEISEDTRESLPGTQEE